MSKKNKNKNQVGVDSSTKNKKMHYLMVLDRSGSMAGVRDVTINNVNEQFNVIRDLAKKENIDATVTLLLFDQNGGSNWFDYVFTIKNINEVIDITADDYVPRGCTPLRDAIGNGVHKLQEALGDKLGDVNTKVLVTIFTDGEENSSREFSDEEINKMIAHLSEDGKFTFTFMGAGGIKNVQHVARSLGIMSSNVAAYDNTAIGHADAGDTLKCALTGYMTNYSRGLDTKLDFFAADPTEKKEKAKK
jgi:uncharacterized protein with von Willebrand factor type A (vWA) domain